MKTPALVVLLLAGLSLAPWLAGEPARAAASTAPAAPPAAHQQLAREIYRELIEINTVTATGDTGRAAEAMAARLQASGLPEADVQVFHPAPRKGNLVARLRGTGVRKALLLMAHLDVVEARREDWSFDPFKLTESDGFFYGRGTTDDKHMAAGFVATLIRLKQEGYRADRDIILVLETDEEGFSPGGPYGIEWLLLHHRSLLDAEYALNEGGGLRLKGGRPFEMDLQTCEKVYQSYWLEVRNPGGHSSLPSKDNAIYHLAEGLARLAKFDFPEHINETTRAYFDRAAALEKGQTALDMKAVAQPNPDAGAVARLSAIPIYNAQLRTTCVATRLEAGHADNALPQRARALVNCRIVPGESVDAVRETIIRVLADDQIAVTADWVADVSPASPLNSEVLHAVEQLTAEFWPGTPVIPIMEAGATDGRFLRNAGIPTYGVDGFGTDIFDVRAHGKDERMPVKSFYEGVEFSYRLVKALSGGE